MNKEVKFNIVHEGKDEIGCFDIYNAVATFCHLAKVKCSCSIVDAANKETLATMENGKVIYTNDRIFELKRMPTEEEDRLDKEDNNV